MNATSDQLTTYKIPATNMPHLEDEIVRLNRRATKLKLKPIVLTILRTIFETRKHPTVKDLTYQLEFKECTVEGEYPKLNGWHILAVIEPQSNGENVIREIPGCDCPTKYQTANLTCDHCNKKRRRSAIFILEHENGETKQVGRSCMKDFLGGESPESIMSAAEFTLSGDSLCKEAQEEGWGWGGRPCVSLNCFVATASIVIRRFGWVSRTTGGETGKTPTANLAWDICTVTNDDKFTKFIRENSLFAEPRDLELAEAAVAWGSELKSTDNNYLFNLGVCCRQSFVDFKNAGYVASVIGAYQRANVVKTPTEKSNSVHLGKIDERMNFYQLKVILANGYMGGMYPKTFIKFVDSAGNTLIWHASGTPDWAAVGDVIDVVGTVVKHDDYKGVKQTTLKRVSLAKEKKPKKTKSEAA